MAKNTISHVNVGINQTEVKQGADELTRAAKEMQKASAQLARMKLSGGGSLTNNQFASASNSSNQAILSVNKAIDKLSDLFDKGSAYTQKNSRSEGYKENTRALANLSKRLDEFARNNGAVNAQGITPDSLQSVMTRGIKDGLANVLKNGEIKGNYRASNMFDRSKNRSNIQDIRQVSKSYSSQLSSLEKRVNNSAKDIYSARQSNSIGYNRSRKLATNYSLTKSDIASTLNNTNRSIETQRVRFNTTGKEINSNISKMSSGNLGEKEKQQLAERNRYLSKELEERLHTIDDLKKYRTSLEELTKKNNQQQRDYKDDVSDGSVKVGINPDSLRGRFMARSFSLVGAASANASNAIKDTAAKGNTLRNNQYDLYGSNLIANGNSVNTYARQLKTASGSAYGNLNGDEFNTLATAYTGATGRTSQRNIMSAEKLGGNLARSGGFGVENTAQLYSASGNLGLRSNKDFQDLGNSLVGAIKDAGLSGKSTEEVQGFNSILQSLQGQSLTSRQQSGIANIYTGLGKNNPEWQGQAGSTAMQQMSSGISASFNNPLMRMAFTGGNSKYQGLNGMARAYGDMQNPLAHPNQTQGMLNNLVNLSGGSKNVAAMRFSQQTGMTYKQAQGAVSAAQNGDFSKWASQNKSASGAKDLKHNESRYNKSGVATIKAQKAIIDASSVDMSSKTDWVRNAKNNTIEGHPVVQSITSGVGQGIGQILMDTMFRSLIKGNGGKGTIVTDTIGGIGDALKDTKLGGKVVNAGSKVAGTGRGLLAKGAAWFGGTAVGSKVMPKILARTATRTGEVASDVSKASTVARVGSKALPTLTRGLSVGSKLFGKVMPLASVAMGGADAVNSLTSRKKGDQERGKGLLAEMGAGAAVGAGIGATAGGVGAVPGAIIGAGTGLLADIVPNASKTIGKGIDYLNPFKTTTAKAATVDSKSDQKKSGYETKAEKWISENKKIIHGYDKMLDKMEKTAAILKNSLNGKGSSSDDSDSDATISGTSGKGEKAIRSMAKKLGKEMGVDPSLVYAQLMLESGNGNSSEAVKDNNYGGVKYSSSLAKGIKGVSVGQSSPEGDSYAKFANTDAFASYYARIQGRKYAGTSSASEYAHKLKQNGYYTAPESDYANQLAGEQKNYAIGGLITKPTLAKRGEGHMPEAVVPLGTGERSQGRSILSHAANYLGMDISQGYKSGSKSSSNTTNVSPVFNINVSGGASSETINKVKQQITESAEKATELMRQKASFYSNDIVQ